MDQFEDEGRNFLHKLFVSMLDDDHGINEETWAIIQEPLYMIDSRAWKAVRATEGRYYLPEGHIARDA